MHSAFKIIAFATAILLASCDEPTSSKPAESDAAATTGSRHVPSVGFERIEFGTGGGFTGRGTGEFLRITSDGYAMRVVAKPLVTDSGPQRSGKYDTASRRISNEDLLLADSILHSPAVLSPAPLPDSAYALCNTIFDGFYWTASAKLTADSTLNWNAPSMGCQDKDGTPLPTPVSEGVTALRQLQSRLVFFYFQVDPVED
jgi:hypothetical protein